MNYLRLLTLVLCLFTLPCVAAEHAWAAPRPIDTTVASVIDGDTFVTQQGQHVRLLGINTPEIKHDYNPSEEGGTEAKTYATQLLNGKAVRLVFDQNDHDRYGRLLAHVYLKDGTWVNKDLVEKGYAHVYTFPDNRSHIAELLAAETAARTAKRGIWQQRRWETLHAEPLPNRYKMGKYNLVEGTPIKAAEVKGVIYLNYGDNWRKDFTVEIPPAAQKLFKAENIDPLTAFTNKRLIVRGRLKPVNGVLITVTHPEQIQLLDSGK